MHIYTHLYTDILLNYSCIGRGLGPLCLWLLWIMLLWRWLYKYQFEYLFLVLFLLFLLTLDVDLLGHTIILCFAIPHPVMSLFLDLFFLSLCALSYIPTVFLNISFPPMSEKLAFDDAIKGTPQPLRPISMWSKNLQILKENVAIEWWISLGTNSLTDTPIIHSFTKYQKVFFFMEFVGKPYLKPIKNVH